MPIACSVNTAVMYYFFFSPRETVPTRIVERVNYCTRTENRERNATQCYNMQPCKPRLKQNKYSVTPLHSPVTSVFCKSGH